MVFPLRKGPSGPADDSSNAPLSNVFFVDGGTTVATADQDGSIGKPFATIDQVLELLSGLDDVTAILTPNTYDDFLLDIPDKTLRLVGWSFAQFVNIDVANAASVTMENILVNNIEVTEASLLMVNSQYNVCTLTDAVSAQIDLATLGKSRLAGGGEPTGSFDVMDAPTITVEVNIPAITAPESANVTAVVPLAQPGDTFSVSGLAPWPVEAMLGMPRCDVSGQVIIPVMAVGGNVPSSTVDLRVTILPVASA